MNDSDKLNHFEAILKVYNENKPLALYSSEEKHSTSPSSNILKPQDVIATVSKQLRDIQKADTLKKSYVRHILKSGQSDFVPIDFLYSQEGFQHHYGSKFETQCVTDTQLIDIVDNVEAMVNENIDVSLKLKPSSSHNEDNPKRKITEGNNFLKVRGMDDNIFTEKDDSKDLVDIKVKCIQKDELSIDEINTDIYKEFHTTYNQTCDDIISLENSIIEMSLRHCNSNSNKTTDKTFMNAEYIDKELTSTLENNVVHKFYIDSSMANDYDFPDHNEPPSSPIFKSYKPLVNMITSSPLIFPLDSFEKFESLAMPLIRENKDIETVKHLINSQIIDNQLIISAANTIPILKEVTNYNEQESENILIQNHYIKTSMKSKQNLGESTSFEDEILFMSDEENEYFHDGHQDLPMTCATKMNSGVDLDESIFVGFQTSSDKCIQVKKDSFLKAKNMFYSMDKDKNVNFTHTGLVDSHDSNDTKSHFNYNLPSKEVSDTSTVENVNSKVLEKLEMKTFKETSILTSEKLLHECSTAFKDIEEDIADKSNEVFLSNVTEKKQEFMGFKTASNKKIQISNASLAKTRNIFEDINLSNIPLNVGFKIENINNHIRQATKVHNSQESTSDCFSKNEYVINDESVNIVDQTLLQEFENESIDEAKHKYNNMHSIALQMLKEPDETENKTSDASFVTTKNAFNDRDHVTGFDLDENCERKIFKDSNILHVQSTSKFFGFEIANNKEIKVSSKALSKTKDLFYDFGFGNTSKQDRVPDNNNLRFNFEQYESTNSNKNIRDKLNSKLNSSQTESEVLHSVFSGFKTANNKVIEISKEAFLKTEKIFHDIDSVNNCKDNILSKVGKNTNDSEKFSYNNIKYYSLSSQMFGPARNESVIVPEKVVSKSKTMFRDILPDVNVNQESHDSEGAIVEISNHNMCSNLIRNKAHLNQENICHDIVSSVEKAKEFKNPAFQGFKTATNKPVIISKESLLKTKKILENIDDIGNNLLFEPASVDFKTTTEKSYKNKSVNEIVRNSILHLNRAEFKSTSDKHVVISEDALVKPNNLFEDADYETNECQYKNEKADYRKKAVENPAKNTDSISKEQSTNTYVFKGFQTASNKRVKISDEAVARSRKIFDEINFDVQNRKEEYKKCISINDSNNNYNVNKENVDNECEKAPMPLVFGFKTGTNKSITVSEDSLKKSRQIFTDFDNDFRKPNKYIHVIQPEKVSAADPTHNINLHNTVDTQLLNNFEETLHTEDFYKDTPPKQCKRSGSPILSCPKAKKRKKFETPYRNDTNTPNIQRIIHRTNKKSDVKYLFSENYKKVKLYSLKDLDKSNENITSVIDPYILNFDYDTLLKFEFDGIRNDFTDARWTSENIKNCFTESVDSNIIPEGWLDNHLKLILWKLISYEIRFPNVMRNVCSVNNVLQQLKYRYDRELCRVERPALRKLLEKDDISTKTMILAIVGVYVDGVKIHCINNEARNIELLVTDGWYCIKACADKMISRLVSDGKIAVGSKIATVGAELLNCEQGISPWEDTSAVRLKIFGNSTRPARWDARLGFHTNGAILSRLSTIDPSGGKVCKTRVIVVRVYPALYVEKLDDGSTVTRSERLEHLHQNKYEMERQNQLEKLYEEVEKEFFDQESSESEGQDSDLKKSLQSGSQLNRLMKKSNDPSQFRLHLTDSQALLMQEYSSRKKEKVLEELQKRVRDKMRAQGLHSGRNVIPLLKIRVAGFEKGGDVKVSKAMVSIWRPSDAILEVVKEGAWIDLFNVVPTAVRNSEIQISAGRQSIFHRSEYKEKDIFKPYIESLQRKCFSTKDLNKNPSMHTDFNEIDSVGIIFLIEPSLSDFETKNGQQFQNVYLTDVDKNFICINFWGGIKKFGYENIFDVGTVVACMNLQKRAGNSRKTIPQYRATELTVFSRTPKLNHIRNMTEELIKTLSGLDRRKFCNDCILIKNNYVTIKYGSEFSPRGVHTSDYSLTRNKIFIDSPLAQNTDVNLNLSGLDFESPFQQTDTQGLSPTALKRKQLVKDKIAKLKMYGEPPPLSKIHIVNQSKNAGSSYKSPLTSNVARVKNVDNSPITTNKLIHPNRDLPLNRTFLVRSGVNPVKLNFSTTSISDGKVDMNPFAEEFEASPPLSLD